jgi:N-methylhydantoinase A/oxoprolinase/acetone carboxylase beta subunit
VGFSKTCYDGDHEDGAALIGLDMGGTSTDVSRYAGKLEHVFETTTAEGEYWYSKTRTWLTTHSDHTGSTAGYKYGSCWWWE